MIAPLLHRTGTPARAGLAVVNVAAADFLLYGSPWALSLTLAQALLGLSTTLVHPHTAWRAGWPLRAGLFVAAIAPLVENVSGLSALISFALLVVFALWTAGRLDPLALSGGQLLNSLTGFLFALPFRLPADFFRWRRTARRLKPRRQRSLLIAAWLMPVILGAVFVFLFSEANPIVEAWLRRIDIQKLMEWLARYVSVARVAFWLALALIFWAILRPRLPFFARRARRFLNLPPATAPSDRPLPVAEPTDFIAILFGPGAILRSLAVFNVLFAVQTALDATYLWGGVALPDGMTYASYAHRGAYPLIVTALLAALFVLVALKPGSRSSASHPIRRLVYLWISQNVVLVISSILRLDLYVGVYSLTYWRIAAFVWMGLVAFGLVAIVARIALQRTGGWLFTVNLSALSAVLYACCFVNFAGLISMYNVTHSLELSGQGVALDVWYLREIGPATIPAIDLYLDRTAGRAATDRPQIEANRREDERRFREMMSDWRAWSFRDWRLLAYLDRRQASASQTDQPTQ